jgi:hypothetical protein
MQAGRLSGRPDDQLATLRALKPEAVVRPRLPPRYVWLALATTDILEGSREGLGGDWNQPSLPHLVASRS